MAILDCAMNGHFVSLFPHQAATRLDGIVTLTLA